MAFQKSVNTKETMRKLTQGWRTYSNASMTSHVLMPYGLSVNIGFAHHQQHKAIDLLVGEESLIEEGYLVPKAHSYDAGYTEVVVHWQDIEATVTTAATPDGRGMVAIIDTAKQDPHKFNKLVVELTCLWNSANVTYLTSRANTANVSHDLLIGEITQAQFNGDDTIQQVTPKRLTVQTTGTPVKHFAANEKSPYISVELGGSIGVYAFVEDIATDNATDTASNVREMTLSEIKAIIEVERKKWEQRKAQFGEFAELYNGMQTCLAWDTVYDPWDDAVYTPVSRQWNNNWGGSVLFCWDTYFGALMASVDNKELAYSNAIAITKKFTPAGFVPNWALSSGGASCDRSQPPVGSMVCHMIYQHYREPWFLEEVWTDLLRWNTWFWDNRRTRDGLFAWGSNDYEVKYNMWAETSGKNVLLGAAYESGLDNSPMYDDVPFDKKSGLMQLEDVGLTGLFINDCRNLIAIAKILGKHDQIDQLTARMNATDTALELLWSEEDGIYMNRRMDTGEFYKRISPTNFYALYSKNVGIDRIARMIDEHYFNENEFYGEFVMPSIARNDPAYPDQNYWRGRIWAPMNYLVYMALRAHQSCDIGCDITSATKTCVSRALTDLADKSERLFLKEWLEMGHVHENYSGDDGWGCPNVNSDKYYHWGALLAYIKLDEQGFCSAK